MSGIFMVIPIIIALVYKETNATIALMITAMLFLILGFILNSLCERKDLSFKDSNRLIFLSFVLLSVIGAIPYFYINATNTDFGHRITDSIFESVSGYTTAGFTVISDPSLLPKSINFYRGLTVFIGGIGIVLLLLVFFYSEERLASISKSLGFDKNNKIRHTFIVISGIYVALTFILGAFAYFVGSNKNWINISVYMFSAISGGGFAPVADMTKDFVINTPLGYMMILGMILGATNLVILSKWFTFKFKETLKSEVPYYFGWIILCFLLIKFAFNLPFFDTIFHTVSANATTGFQYLNLGAQSDVLKVFFILFMLVGGTSLSTAGGVKIFRIILMFKAIHKSVHESITDEDKKITLFEKEYRNHEVVMHLVVMILYVGLITISAFILHFVGNYQFTDSLFVITSAATTTGLDVGIVNASLSAGLKWMLAVIMLLGRVEIFAFLIMFSRAKEKDDPEDYEIEEKRVKKVKKTVKTEKEEKVLTEEKTETESKENKTI